MIPKRHRGRRTANTGRPRGPAGLKDAGWAGARWIRFLKVNCEQPSQIGPWRPQPPRTLGSIVGSYLYFPHRPLCPSMDHPPLLHWSGRAIEVASLDPALAAARARIQEAALP